MSFYKFPSLPDVQKASALIKRKIKKTPIRTSLRLSYIASFNARRSKGSPNSQSGIELFFKLENLQNTGSFKFRGASHFLARLEDHELLNGVVTYSTGNHALAVAHAAQIAAKERSITIPTYVVLPSNCPTKKVEAARRYGATAIFAGTSSEARIRFADSIQKFTGAALVPPADHLDIVLGQATAVSELFGQVAAMGRSSLDVIVVPSGGGGLLVGAAAVCKPQGVRLFGVEPECGGPDLTEALRHGMRADPEATPKEMDTIADGLRSSTGAANWEHIKVQDNVEGMFTASEHQIKEALKLVIEIFGFIIEPSAAVPVAVVLFNTDFHRLIAKEGGNVKIGIVITGGNASADGLRELIPGLKLNRGMSS